VTPVLWALYAASSFAPAALDKATHGFVAAATEFEVRPVAIHN